MRIATVREIDRDNGKGKGLIANVLYISKEEYEQLHDPKGVISSEYMSRNTNIRKSFMWNRTLYLNKKLYVEGLTMVIE